MTEINYKPDHVALTVSDLERSMEWYQTMFGFEKQTQFDRPDLKLRGAMMRLQSFGVELFQPYEAGELPEYRREWGSDLSVTGTKHLALLVADVQRAYVSLESKGADIAGDIVTGKTAKYFVVKDPDGILVEVKEALGGK
ncbi:MAG: VOC family protein [Nanoarchaeota archaeon]|nr:VOC family protein [Nanoarchaeota archaeon]